MSASVPKGVPQLPKVDSVGRHGLGVGLGLAAAGLTAAAGFAADRLSRDRRTALALDETVGDQRYVEIPDEEVVVVATDGVELHVEIDHGAAPGVTGGVGDSSDTTTDGSLRPTIVLCHGYCLNLRSWVFQRRALRAAGYRVVLWDHRGHGRSGTGERSTYTIEQLADDLVTVLREVVPQGPVVLVGHSMGGMTMMALGLEHEELVRERVVGAAFVATSPGDLSGVSYGFGRVGGNLIRRLTPLTAGAMAGRQGIVDFGVRQGRDIMDFIVDWGSFGSPVPLSVAQLTTDMIFGTRMEVISAFFPMFDTIDKRDALSSFDGVEALVISGTADRLTPVEHSAEIVRLVPGAEHVVVEDAGHVIMLEHPDVLNEHLLDLVTRASRASRLGGTHPPRRGVRSQVSDVGSRRAARRALRRKRHPDRSRGLPDERTAS